MPSSAMRRKSKETGSMATWSKPVDQSELMALLAERSGLENNHVS
jgi:hypothetical protein